MKGIREAALSKETISHPEFSEDLFSSANKYKPVVNNVRLAKTVIAEEMKAAIIDAFARTIDELAEDPFIAQRSQELVDEYLQIKFEEEKDGIDASGAYLDCIDDLARVVDINIRPNLEGPTELAQIAVALVMNKLGIKFEGKPSGGYYEDDLSDEGIYGDLDKEAYDNDGLTKDERRTKFIEGHPDWTDANDEEF